MRVCLFRHHNWCRWYDLSEKVSSSSRTTFFFVCRRIVWLILNPFRVCVCVWRNGGVENQNHIHSLPFWLRTFNSVSLKSSPARLSAKELMRKFWCLSPTAEGVCVYNAECCKSLSLRGNNKNTHIFTLNVYHTVGESVWMCVREVSWYFAWHFNCT